MPFLRSVNVYGFDCNTCNDADVESRGIKFNSKSVEFIFNEATFFGLCGAVTYMVNSKAI